VRARRALDSVKDSLRAAYEQLAPPLPRDAGEQPSAPLDGLRRWVDALLVVDDGDERDLERLIGSHPGVSRSNTIAIVSPLGKRGAGKTTMTFLLGNVLASRFRLRVVAIDGAPRSGALAELIAPELRCERSLEDLVSRAAGIAGIADLRPFVSRLPTGLDLLTQGRDDQRQARAMTAELFDGLLSLLSIFYEVVLLDVGADARDPLTHLALERSRRLVAVTTPEWVDAGIALDGLQPFPAERTTVVLNKSLPETEAEHAALELSFRERRLRHSVTIPLDRGLPYALSAGAYSLDALERPSRLAIKQLGLAIAEVLA
jgi:MinD-like ATPase involved in chromosome partitioning or flagellar assembly